MVELIHLLLASATDLAEDWHSPVDVAADAPSESWPAMPATCPAQDCRFNFGGGCPSIILYVYILKVYYCMCLCV